MDEKRKALLVVLVFFFLAFGARLSLMDLRPLHHDEGVNGDFVSRIVEGEGWKYDAENYHGPTLFYITTLSFMAFGHTVFALRIVPVLFGSLLVLVPYLFRKRLGIEGLIAASFALAFSPALLYYSMFAIHEILFSFFLFLSLALVLKLAVGEGGGLRLLLPLFAGFSLALLFATKEASFVIGSFVVLLGFVVALAGVLLARKRAVPAWRGLLSAGRMGVPAAGKGPALKGRERKKAGALWIAGSLAVAVIVFLAVFAVLFSSFFYNPAGINDSVKSVFQWGERVVVEKGHDKPFPYYFELLLFSELPLLFGGIAGIIIAAWKRNAVFSAFGVFFLFLFFGVSLVPYKTPWIIANMLPPLALLLGFAFREFNERVGGRFVPGVAIVLGVLAAGILFPAIWVNVVNPEDGGLNKLVYVQTTNEARLALDRAIMEDGKICVSIESGSTWPISWLLRGENVEYYGKDLLDSSEVMGQFDVAIVDREKEEKAGKGLPGYERLQFDLRPGMPLTAFYRQNSNS